MDFKKEKIEKTFSKSNPSYEYPALRAIKKVFSIQQNGEELYLVYTPSISPDEWDEDIEEELRDRSDDESPYKLKRLFSVSKYNLKKVTEDSIYVVLGKISENGYFKIDKGIFNIPEEFDIYMHKSLNFIMELFAIDRQGLLMPQITKLIDEDLYIGGAHESAVPEDVFRNLISTFPTRTELEHYRDKRICLILDEFVSFRRENISVYNHYMNKKPSISFNKISTEYIEYEIKKYDSFLERLKKMLDIIDTDSGKINEDVWQKEIMHIIRLIYPKYIAVLSEVKTKNPYFELGKTKAKTKIKKIDLVLVDVNGNIDIIEIKKPSNSNTLITERPNYRNNYIPKVELSGTIMQIEKYIFYLNKSGRKGEEQITKDYKKELPHDFKIKITNPAGLLIAGRSGKYMSTEQKNDFEIIKRKYNNIIDIITYDDLIERLENIIEMFKKKK